MKLNVDTPGQHLYKIMDKDNKRIDHILAYDTDTRMAVRLVTDIEGKFVLTNGDVNTETVHLPDTYAVAPDGQRLESTQPI
jgi:hypothetical protein